MKRLDWLVLLGLPTFFVLVISFGIALAQQVPRDPTAGNVAGNPVTGVFSGADTSSQAVTLAGVANKTTYICGFTISGLGATSATAVTATIATLAKGDGTGVTWSYSYVFASGATAISQPLAVQFSMCIPASAIGAAITVTVPGAAGNTATQINAHGYQL